MSVTYLEMVSIIARTVSSLERPTIEFILNCVQVTSDITRASGQNACRWINVSSKIAIITAGEMTYLMVG